MTDTLKQYLISRINRELTKRGIDISKVSYDFDDGRVHDDVDEFDGKQYQWAMPDSVFVTLPHGNYSGKFWKYLYRLENRLQNKTSKSLELADENLYSICWINGRMT